MHQQQPKYKRRIIVIKKALQFKYIAVVLLSMILVALTVGWDVYYTVGKAFMELNHPDLFPMMMKINNLMIGKLIILLVIVFIIALFVSHKFAGPVFRFEKSAEIVASGDLTYRVFLRSGDELIDLRDKFNFMIQELQKKVENDKRLSNSIAEKLSAISSQLSHPNISPSELSEIAKQLVDITSELGKIGSGFKV